MDNDREIVDVIFNNYFGSSASGPTYIVRVTSLSNHNSKINARLTLKKNQRYCCSEITCHFKADWARIREKASRLGLELGSPLTIEFAVLVENGALIEVNESIGVPLSSNKYQYSWSFTERSG